MSNNINFDYKNLSPFKWFVLENFPFIEADFDALTEWQLFCKLGKEINKIIDSQNIVGEQAENLTNAFNNLKNYVDNYFDNLDVQDEINNKLNEMATDGTLQEIISVYLNSKAIFGFDTVADLKQATNLINGSYAKTLGYYNINDFGGCIYRIIENDNYVIDNGQYIELNNGLIAELIINKTINVRQYGVYENDSNDDTIQLQKLINFAKSKNIKIVGNKNPIKLTSTIDIPVYVDIENVYFKFYESNNYINNYGIFVNANSTHNNWQVAYPDALRGSMVNCTLRNASENSINGIYNYSNQLFNNLYFAGFNISFKVDSNYLDSWKFTNITVESRYNSNDYNIQFGYLGDQITIDNIHYLAYDTNAIAIGSGHNGIRLNNIISHGTIKCEGSNILIDNLHMEADSSQIICINTMLKLSGAYLYHNKTASSHNFDLSDNSYVILDNCKIRYEMDKSDLSTDDYDANLTSSTLIGRNCYKLIGNRQNISENLFANFKTNLGVSLSPEFIYSNKYSFDIKDNQLFKPRSANGIRLTEISNWKENVGTYYYAVKPVADFTRQIHYWQYTNTYNINVPDTTKGVAIGAESGFWRVYRGTTSGSYDKYVDISIERGTIIDDGVFCNGFKWQTRTPSGVDTFLSFDETLSYQNKNVIIFAKNTPTAGTWKKGDIILYTNYNGSNDKGWICTVAGTPGTWQTL